MYKPQREMAKSIFTASYAGLIGGGFTGPLYVECVGSNTPEGIDRDLAFTLGYIVGILSSIGCC